MKVVSISAMPGGPACQSFLLSEYLKGCSGYDAVDIAFADPRQDYLKYPCTLNTYNCDEDTEKTVIDWLDGADIFIIHNFDPRVVSGDPWRPTLPLKLHKNTYGIPLRRGNVIWKLHGSDAVRYALSVHGFEHRHGQLMVGSPDPRIWTNAKCVNWIPPMMDPEVMNMELESWKEENGKDAGENYLSVIREGGKFIINHSATARRKKGSNILTEAMQHLDKAKYYADITQGASWGGSLWHKSICDVYFDQVYAGFYGVSAVEALMLGKPVIVHLSSLVKSWLRGLTDWYPFIETASVTNPAQMLANRIQMSKDYQNDEYKISAQEWAKKFHGSATVGEQWRHLIEGMKT